MKRKYYTKFLGICISERMDDLLTKLSDDAKVSKSEIVRTAIEHGLNYITEEDNFNDEQ